ncbi:ATP-dependent RNA helicase, putative [Plasmodium berghei]|uniref:ATP-dependent RNA helicase, putative n=2 Tax=Plasmodium berghei TaxID=5821 RepID=A0A509ADB0_PLABA|nr:ATP-dependent RNA helicase, putative [Plasmodium berghei ANKA]CXH79455.1 ATP-dependent RNA helicase, putative [Plasmodium berghei]SCM18954.1 ATP-dependent RNA helicase, putative [Plasmodium berghei]SCN21507.1 ATP-dependent RNA helicase, putative [Plasmodium berghei]SCO58756.1 ATP-dependent RNA helicase, putative [Plasmodium berghei]SCO58774.1 ATP-dependent RNA helicase, putative [Plasmodium berghei]|eukprot:XP_034419609.1 ATP-dependent RNA helicase, putative [Plasmodium berghei ANKA]
MSENIDDLFNVFEEDETKKNLLNNSKGPDHLNTIVEEQNGQDNIGYANGGYIMENERNINNKTTGAEIKENEIEMEINYESSEYNAPIDYKINVDNIISNHKSNNKIKDQIKEEIYNEVGSINRSNNFFNNKIRKTNGKNDQTKTEIRTNAYKEPVREKLIENSKTINNDDVLVLEEFGSDVNCIHKCVRPQSYVHNKLSESITPARTYKFELDTFQKKSIECLERNESVLVSAHTSAGKTVIAEYAIALGLRDKQRVIYTSPIKALSNQKYRDLSEEFKDVGLITGDISINPEASIIVMTTEILRSMLYRGSSLTKEVKWVIFDEIHYMRDRDRGVIWEETIILLPLMVRFIFLSATIPNGIQFAEWVSSIKNQACHIVYTDYRPTPLQHYIYPTSSESVFLICDENKNFKKDNFIKAVNALKDKSMLDENNQSGGNNKFNKRMRKNTYDIEKIVQMCHSRNYTPLIIFAFSKKECEVNATTLHKVNLTDDSEKEIIKELYENAIQILADDDRALPQVQFILPLLLRGIGIHHGGLLPIIKEIIEIMFQESLLKVLFSTETFSMGINMPAKTVVFTSLKKFDGLEKRLITSGEYIQMAGRAGRRGLDDRGIVIIMLDSPLHWKDAEKLFVGEANRLVSQFHLGYNMILNLLRIEGITPEFMIERSFIQYQMKKNLFEQIFASKKVEQKSQEILNILTNIYLDQNGDEFTKAYLLNQVKTNDVETILKNKNVKNERTHILLENNDPNETKTIDDYNNSETSNKVLKNYITTFSEISNYYITRNKLVELGETYRSLLTSKKNITQYLTMGRLLYAVEDDLKWGWCICIEGRITEEKYNINHKNNNTGNDNHIIGYYTNHTNSSNDTKFNKKNSIENNRNNTNILVVECLVPYIQNKKRKLPQNNDDDGEISKKRDLEFLPAHDRLKAQWKVMTFYIKCIYQISAVVLNIEKPFDKSSEEEIEKVKNKYNTMVNCIKGEQNIPVIGSNQMNIKDDEFFKIVKNIYYYENILNKNKLLNNKNLNKYYQLYSKYVALQFEKNILDCSIEQCKFIVLKKELNNMLILLESLNYIEITYKTHEKNQTNDQTNRSEGENYQKQIDTINEKLLTQNDTHNDITNKNNNDEKNYVVTMKGQIASAILSVDELVISELFFSNFFSKYTYDYICALLSCFVYDESTNKEITINDPILIEGYQQIIKTATIIANKMNQCGMNINVKDYLEKFKSAIMPIVLLWARGHSFMEILADSQIYEGSIIRTLRRLDELLRQMICAFRGINNDNMCEILTTATKKLRRGIPFSPSLYL